MLKKGVRPILFSITTKLTRYKIMSSIIKIILSPFYLLSLTLYGLSRFTENLHDWIEDGLEFILMKLVHTFGWNEAAKKQIINNPKKFVNKK
jgi:hypothetical protein